MEILHECWRVCLSSLTVSALRVGFLCLSMYESHTEFALRGVGVVLMSDRAVGAVVSSPNVVVVLNFFVTSKSSGEKSVVILAGDVVWDRCW